MKPGSLAQQKLLCVATALTLLILSLLTGYFLLHLTKHFESFHLQTPLFKLEVETQTKALEQFLFTLCLYLPLPTLDCNSVVIFVISTSNYANQKIPDRSLLSVTLFAAGIITFLFPFCSALHQVLANHQRTSALLW